MPPSSEADTCRKYILPKLYASGWNDDQICEQRSFTDGRIIVHGNRATRRPGKRADYLLRYTRDQFLAVIEAKPEDEDAAKGLQQAKDYAEILGLKFAYSTNGKEIIEFDYTTGIESRISDFPTADELWSRLRKSEKITDDVAGHLLTLANLTTGKEPRYYQRIAIDQAVKSIVQGKKRVLLTMATGTGKTVVAFQICWKLWSSKWNAKGDPTRKPRILYLADRNFLVDDPKDKTFSVFGDARHKIEGGVVTHGRELYFSTYQSIAKDANRPGLYKQYASDFFDLIIVDECHRGSAKDDSNWRDILEYFKPAYQLGMTATPLREENRDTYLYFCNPIYQYSLKQGINDGFLAPYRVHRVVTQWDAAGWRPSKEDMDRYGRRIPDEAYGTPDFEKKVALLKRTECVAKHLTAFLKKTDRFGKTIVFCVDQEHASEMRTALNNLNADLIGTNPSLKQSSNNPSIQSSSYPDYVCRVTSDEGDIGRGHMQRFQDVETRTPVILTTSQLLTTGLDAPTCRNVVLLRLVNSMVEFKQIIGRGTRVREDYGKLWFNILDYTGTATRNFADPAFDGDPAFATQEEIDEHGQVKKTEIITPEELEIKYDEDKTPARVGVAEPPTGRRKYYFDGGHVEIAAELVHELDADGKQLRVVKLSDYTAEKVRTLCTSPEDLRVRWANAEQRAEIVHQLADRGIDFANVAAQAGKPDADPFDLLCHLAFNAPVLTRRQRADRVKKKELAFFNYLSPEAREILNDLLEKYATDGELQFTLPDVLKLPSISQHGNVNEIIGKFGGADQLRNAVNQLQTLLYGA
ncbi:MAG TPA: DEAD/DEAH box helicase [Lentisphaeria bacterium]|nr:MAG: DEAD/DEAH box helicase [Lentisphaerae bacterium GWF2_50_93]HCE45438.1 DEAD/DEAH box helicase [Lentisphaeria bacterium]